MAFVGKYRDLVSKDVRGEAYSPPEPLDARVVDHYKREFERIRGTLGITADEILSKRGLIGSDKVWEALRYFIGWKFLNHLLITETENMISACYELKAEVSNGGFHQYFFNSSGDRWPFVLKLLTEGDDAEGSRMFKEVLTIFPNGEPSVDRGERWQQLDEIRAKDEKGMWAHFDKYTDEFYRNPFPNEKTFWSVIETRKSDINMVWA